MKALYPLISRYTETLFCIMSFVLLTLSHTATAQKVVELECLFKYPFISFTSPNPYATQKAMCHQCSLHEMSSSVVYSIEQGTQAATPNKRMYGIMNLSGYAITEPIYDKIILLENDSLAVVSKNEWVGIIDTRTGHELLPCVYSLIEGFGRSSYRFFQSKDDIYLPNKNMQNIAKVTLPTGQIRYIDTKNNTIPKPNIENLNEHTAGFFTTKRHWGYKDKHGRIVLKPICTGVAYCRNDHALAGTTHGESYYINEDGDKLKLQKGLYAWSNFDNGYAITIGTSKNSENTKYYLIDKTGSVIYAIPDDYKVTPNAHGFSSRNFFHNGNFMGFYEQFTGVFRIKDISTTTKDVKKTENAEIAYQLFNKGLKFQEQEEYKEAIRWYSDALNYCENEMARRGRVYCNMMLKNYFSTLIDINTLIDRNPNEAALYFNRGIALLNLENYYNARIDFQLASNFDPSHENAKQLASQVNDFVEQCDAAYRNYVSKVKQIQQESARDAAKEQAFIQLGQSLGNLIGSIMEASTSNDSSSSNRVSSTPSVQSPTKSAPSSKPETVEKCHNSNCANGKVKCHICRGTGTDGKGGKCWNNCDNGRIKCDVCDGCGTVKWSNHLMKYLPGC